MVKINRICLLLLLAAVFTGADDPPRRKRLRSRRRDGPGPFRPGGLIPFGGQPLILPMGAGFGGYPPMRYNPLPTVPIPPPLGLTSPPPPPPPHSYSHQSFAPPLPRHALPSAPAPIHVGAPFSPPFQSYPYRPHAPLRYESPLSLNLHSPVNYGASSSPHSAPLQRSVETIQHYRTEPIYIRSPSLNQPVEQVSKPSYEASHFKPSPTFKPSPPAPPASGTHSQEARQLHANPSSGTLCVNCDVGKHSSHFSVQDDGSVIKEGFHKHFISHSSVYDRGNFIKYSDSDYKDSLTGRNHDNFGSGSRSESVTGRYGLGEELAGGEFAGDYVGSSQAPFSGAVQKGSFGVTFGSSSHGISSPGRDYAGGAPFSESVGTSSYSSI